MPTKCLSVQQLRNLSVKFNSDFRNFVCHVAKLISYSEITNPFQMVSPIELQNNMRIIIKDKNCANSTDLQKLSKNFGKDYPISKV